MSDGAAAGEAAAGDPYAGAKANLRDTIKWLTTAFAALATAILAGSPLTGVGSLTGLRLVLALGGAAVGVLCIFAAIAVTLSLLATETFSLGALLRDARLKTFLDARAADILPPEFSDIAALVAHRDAAIATLRRTAANPSGEEYREAAAFYRQIDGPLRDIGSLAHFELLRRTLRRRAVLLFALALGALVGLGFFAWAVGRKDDGGGTALLSLEAGPGWQRAAEALALSCGGEGHLRATLRGTPLPGWIEIQLLAPEACAGVRLMLPAALTAAPAAKT